MDITINILELASELAHKDLVKQWDKAIQIYEDEKEEVTVYTEEAQDIFNYLYDKYYTIIEQCKA